MRDSTAGPNATGNGKVSSYWVMVASRTRGRRPVSKPSNSASAARPPSRVRSCPSSCRNARADWGVVSRPSSQAWMATGSPCRCPSMTAATRWWSSACTPPLPIRPSRWRVCPVRRSSPHSSTSAGMWKKAPESIACEMRTMSCGTTRPAPRFRCPTSLLPICPSGSPTASPDALSSVRGAFAQRRCQVGVRPSSIAFPTWPGRKPQPSSTIRTTGVRGPCLFAILQGMQFSHALRALPVVCSFAPALVIRDARPAASPDTAVQAAARYRVATDGEWFYQEVTGKRLARLARGAVVAGGATHGEWIGATPEGRIFGAAVGGAPPAGVDLAVVRPPAGDPAAPPAPPCRRVPRARRTAGGHPDTLHAPQGAVQVRGVGARAVRGVGQDVGSRVGAAGGARGRERGRAARRTAALCGADAALDPAVHRRAAGGRAAARNAQRRDLLPRPWALTRARIRLCHRPGGKAGPGRGPRPARHHSGDRPGAGGAQPLPRESGARPPVAGAPIMNDLLRERLLRKLEALPEEKAYLVLDYVEFLESKYAERPAGAAPFQKVAETLEDTMRAGRVPVGIIKGTMDAVGKAG